MMLGSRSVALAGHQEYESAHLDARGSAEPVHRDSATDRRSSSNSTGSHTSNSGEASYSDGGDSDADHVHNHHVERETMPRGHGIVGDEDAAEDGAYVYTAARHQTLPMGAASDPASAGAASIATFLPYLERFNVDRSPESTDYFYGSALGHNRKKMTTNRLTMGPTWYTRLSEPMPPERFFHGQSGGEDGPHSAAFGAWREGPAAHPPAARDDDGKHDDAGAASTHETTVVSIACDLVHLFLTPLTVHSLEECVHQWFPIAPTVPHMLDFFQKNYIVPAASSNAAAFTFPGAARRKVDVAVAGVRVRLLHAASPTGANEFAAVDEGPFPESALERDEFSSSGAPTGVGTDSTASQEPEHESGAGAVFTARRALSPDGTSQVHQRGGLSSGSFAAHSRLHAHVASHPGRPHSDIMGSPNLGAA